MPKCGLVGFLMQIVGEFKIMMLVVFVCVGGGGGLFGKIGDAALSPG